MAKESLLEKISLRLQCLDGETSPHQIKIITDQLKTLLAELAVATYEAKGKFHCHAALDFVKSAGKSFAAMAGDLKETRERLPEDQNMRRNTFRALRAKMERLAEEMKEVYAIINRL